MAVAVKTSGSQTTSGTTEHDLATVTDAGAYCLSLDINALANGSTPDTLEARIYTKCRSSDTERLLKVYTFVGLQTEAIFESPTRLSPHHSRYTIKMAAGSNRAVPWAVYNA